MRYERIRYAPSYHTAPTSLCFTLLALMLVLCLPSAYGTAAQPFGEWESSIALEPATGTWSIETDFTLGCALTNWAAESRTLIENDEWENQDFELTGSIAGINIESDLRFEPYKDRFRDWITEFDWETEQLMLTLTTKLTRTTDWLILELARDGDTVEIDTSFRLRAPTGACGLLFYDASVDLAFEWCGIETDLEITLDDDGFDELVLELKDMVHPRIPWAAFDLEVTRTVSKTAIELSPELALTTPWCAAHLELEFDGSLPNTPSFFPLAIDETALSWEVADWEIEATFLAPSAASCG